MVRDKKVHLEVVQNVMIYAMAIGFKVLELSFSPIKGPEGNIEYLLYVEKAEKEPSVVDDKMKEEIHRLVERAHETL